MAETVHNGHSWAKINTDVAGLKEMFWSAVFLADFDFFFFFLL